MNASSDSTAVEAWSGKQLAEVGGWQLDASGLLDDELLCTRCQYLLRGLDPDSRCPECGTAIADSCRFFFCFAEPDWLKGLQSGVGWLLISIVAWPFCLFYSGLLVAAPGPWGHGWPVLPVALVALCYLTPAGCRLMAIRHLGRREPTVSVLPTAKSTMVARIAVALEIGSGLLGCGLLLFEAAAFAAGLIAILSSIAGFIAAITLLIRLMGFAARAPARDLVRRTSWLLRVLLGGLAAIIAPAIVMNGTACLLPLLLLGVGLWCTLILNDYWTMFAVVAERARAIRTAARWQ